MKIVHRHDVVRFDARKAQKLDNGFLRAPAQISRIGIYDYLNEDGSTRRELRTPDEVFHADSLASFAMMPVTDGHPVEGWVTADNANRYQRGTMGESLAPAPDGVHVAGMMMITDAALVGKVQRGESPETSCGYACNVDETPGVVDAALLAKHPSLQPWAGQRFDVRQMNIRGNHVAVLPRGRAGSEARVKLDKGDAIVITDSPDAGRHPQQEASVKITIRGITFDVPDQAAEALLAERNDQAATIASVQGQVTKLTADLAAAQGETSRASARADAAEALVKTEKARADAASDRKAVLVIVRDSMEILDVAHRAGLKDLKLDESFDALAVKRLVAEKLLGIKLDGKDATYVAASFDIAKGRLDEQVTGTEVVEVIEGQGKGGTRQDGEETDARQDFLDRQAEAWKKPIPGAVKAQ